MRSKIRIIFVISLIILGLASSVLVFYPWWVRIESRAQAEKAAEVFLEQYATETTVAEEEAPPKAPTGVESREEPQAIYSALRAAMQAYNDELIENEQYELYDTTSYSRSALPFEEYGFASDAPIGVLQIPSIEVNMPIYSGASSQNLAKGAALLTGSSFPIGGKNTNAVLGAHRGWNAEDYLRDVEEVAIGDEVIVTNLWETLHYTVVEIKIIEPDDLSQILLQPDRDLVTIFTCHPYASGGKYRYLLICERCDATSSQVETEDETVTEIDTGELATAEAAEAPAEEIESAVQEIRWVAALPWVGVAILLLCGTAAMVTILKRKE